MRTLVVDGTYILYRNFHQPKAWDLSIGEVKTGGTYVFLKSLRQALDRVPDVGRVVVAWDGGRSSRRKTIFPDYKANRDDKAKSKDHKGQEVDLRAEILQQRLMLEAAFPLLGVKSIVLPEREGDDIAWMVTRLAGRAVVMSDDKDMLSFLTPTVNVYRPGDEQYYTWEFFREEYGFDADVFTVYKAIVGDKSDNISGVKGAGPVTAAKFCQSLQDKHHKNLAAALLEAKKSKEKKTKAIFEQADVLVRNLKLMDCSLERFTPSELEVISGTLNAPVTELSHETFIHYCGQYDFFSLTNEVWFQPFSKLA